MEVIELMQNNTLFFSHMRNVFTAQEFLLKYFYLTGKLFLTSTMQTNFDKAVKNIHAEFDVMPKIQNFLSHQGDNKIIIEKYPELPSMPFEKINSYLSNKELYYYIICFAYNCNSPNMFSFHQYYTNGTFTLYDKRSNIIYFLKKIFANQKTITYETIGIKEIEGIKYEDLQIGEINEVNHINLIEKINNDTILTADEIEKIKNDINIATDTIDLKDKPSFIPLNEVCIPKYISTKKGVSISYLIEICAKLKQDLEIIKNTHSPLEIENSSAIYSFNIFVEKFESFVKQYLEIYNNKIEIDKYINNNLRAIIKTNLSDTLLEKLSWLSVNTLSFICDFYSQLTDKTQKQNYINYLDQITNIATKTKSNIFVNYFSSRSDFAKVSTILIENRNLAITYLENDFSKLTEDDLFALCKYTLLFPNEKIDINKLAYYKTAAIFFNELSYNFHIETQFSIFIQNNIKKLNLCIDYFTKHSLNSYENHSTLFKTIYIYIDFINANNIKSIIETSKKLLDLNNKAKILTQELECQKTFLAKFKKLLVLTIQFNCTESYALSNSCETPIANLIIKNISKNKIAAELFSKLSDKALEFLVTAPFDLNIINILQNIISNKRKLNIFNAFCESDNDKIKFYNTTIDETFFIDNLKSIKYNKMQPLETTQIPINEFSH